MTTVVTQPASTSAASRLLKIEHHGSVSATFGAFGAATAAARLVVHREGTPPARIHELLNSLSPAGKAAAEEVKTIIARRLESKLARREISRLAYFRTRARITQVELAERSGIPQPNISKLERTGNVSLRMAKRLAPALNISVGELLGIDGEGE